jgi:hypothetical protein
MATRVDEVTTDEPPLRLQPPPTDQETRPAIPWWRRVHWGLVIVLVVAAVPRWLWLDYARPEPVSDFRHYLDSAINLVDFGFLGIGTPSAWRLPAFPAFLAAGITVSRDTFFLSAYTVALTVVQVGLTYWLAWLVFRRRSAAFVAGLTAAVAPAFVVFAPVLASEHLLAVFVLGALIAAMKAQHTGWWMAALSGVLLGAGVLTRGEAGAYLPAIVLVVGVGTWKAARTRQVLTTLGACALVVAGLALVVVPWVIRNEKVVGEGSGLSTTGGFNFYLAHSPGPYGWRTPLPLPLQVEDEVLRNEFAWKYGLQYVRDHPEDWVPTIRDGTRELLAPSSYAAFYATVFDDRANGVLQTRGDLGARGDAISLAGRSSQWLLWAGLVGLLLVPVWRKRAWLAVIGIALANWVVYAVIFWAQARYRFVVDALACVAVGAVPAVLAATASWVNEGWPDPAPAPSTHHPDADPPP